MCSDYHDLSSSSRVSSPIPPIIEENLGSVVGLDDSLEIRQIGPITAARRVVCSAKSTANPSFSASLGDEEVLSFISVWWRKADAPSLGIAEANSIERFELNVCRLHG
jgi:hypothetical protein